MKTNALLIVLFLLSLVPVAVNAGNWKLEKISEGGEDVWVIDSKDDLIWLSDPLSFDAGNDGSNDFTGLPEKWAANYKLANNILFDSNAEEVDWNNDNTIDNKDLTGFLPVGSLEQPFSGNFNGSYDTIYNLWINNPGTGNTGLFGVTKGADIRQVGLENLRIQVRNANVGGLVGQSLPSADPNTENSIRNCFVKGEITMTEVSGDANVGGLLGMGQDIMVQGCYAVASVKSGHTGNKVGGLAGSILGGSIEDSYANAWVSGAAEAGGLIGYVNNTIGDVTISNCYSSGSAVGDNPVSSGGFLGTIAAGEVRRCHWNSESSINERAVGSAGSGLVLDISAQDSKAFADAANFPGWDFGHVWELADQSTKILVFGISYKAPSVEDILNDGQGDFDPWNTERWERWYNLKAEIIRPFYLNTDIRFASRDGAWIPTISPDFDAPNLFEISKPGIAIDGNNIVIDITTEQLKLPLEQLYTMGRDPWENACQLQGMHYNLPKREAEPVSTVESLTIMGFRRGFKIDNLDEVHPLIVSNCRFNRNGIGFYTNGNGTVLDNCDIMENGNGGIYSGSKSHDNKIINNRFRDNALTQHQYSYADIIADTYHHSLIEGNHFLPSEVNVDQRRIGVSVFRNMGEDDNLREQMPHKNIIRNNDFNGYSVAVHIGARNGRRTGNDITGEGRDYAFYNLIDSNYIGNTSIGIKINTEGNSLNDNRFVNVPEKIVLHCVFFKLKNTSISMQASDSVKLWYVLEDYSEYSHWFAYQDDLNGSIDKAEKRIEVHSTIQSPVFPTGLDSIFILNPPDKGAEFMLEDHRLGLPFVSDTGEFSLDLPGDEIVALWDEKIARVNSTDYYSIPIFDDKGTEINRCGLSEVKWAQLAVGYFIRPVGEMEIAVVPATPIEGKYPVYIFRRGFRVPEAIWYPDNTDPSIKISTDPNHKLVVTFSQ
ncbi:hypothetical protein ACFLTU_05260 [Bacteroidota bacterium]